MKRDTEDGAENTTHLKINSSISVGNKLHSEKVRCYKLSKYSEEESFAFVTLSNILEHRKIPNKDPPGYRPTQI